MTKTYPDFIKSKPKPFYGDNGVDSLIQWIKEIESKCVGEHRVKFETCVFIGRVNLWWIIQFKVIRTDEAYATPREELKKQTIKEFLSRQDVARAEQEFSHLITKELSMAFYIVCFEYLVSICLDLVNSEI